MSGTFPASPGASTCNLTGVSATTVSTSSSGKRQARKTGGHLWRASLAWSRLPRADLAPIFGFVNAQQGSFESFQIVLPNYATPVGAGGSMTAGSASAGATSMTVSGGSLKSGDVLKFSNHSKVYMCTSDISGGGSLKFIPALITNVSGGSVTINNVPFTMYMDGDITEWKGSAPNLGKFSAKMIEAIS